MRAGRPGIRLFGARLFAAAGIASVLMITSSGASTSDEEDRVVSAWRAARVQALTSPTGWLSLEGLLWLSHGVNTFGSGKAEQLRLDHPQLARHAGIFTVDEKGIRFAAAGSRSITLHGRPVTSVTMDTDIASTPTVLRSGTLEFFIIERGGRYGVRIRDRESPRRRDFRGLSYFPTDDAWVFDARFEPYDPAHTIQIINILGMEVPMTSPGAVVFERDGRLWRLDTVVEAPDAEELFIMFADATSGRETYGGGRFLTAPLPKGESVRLDFNLAYNPPCAFNTFATCPLPPPQNRLELPVTAGELKYAAYH